jgi:hypothetical protein
MMGGISGCGLTHRPPTAEILDNRNLMIWDAAIHCTLVALDIAMVELCCTLAYKPRRKRSPWDEAAASGGQDMRKGEKPDAVSARYGFAGTSSRLAAVPLSSGGEPDFAIVLTSSMAREP